MIDDLRSGYGYDVHAHAPGYPLVLGGVTVPHEQGAVGHSDADVILHVICDALLGALALGDIGHHFPDTDPAYKGIDSALLLERVYALVRARDWALANLDCTLCLQRPKVAGYVPAMRARIAEILGVDVERVSVKATTTEKLGFVGTEAGVSAHAVVLLRRSVA
jgi:2-C-methyl-D-erythritol 2,4-cyclodiphosphate synthase